MFTPTLLQIKIQWKPFKIFSRTSLGVGSGLFLLSSMIFSPMSIQGVVIRVISIAFFVTVAKLSLRLRSNHSNSPCINCPEGSFPYCSYKLDDMNEIIKQGNLEVVPREFLISTIASISKNMTTDLSKTPEVIND